VRGARKFAFQNTPGNAVRRLLVNEGNFLGTVFCNLPQMVCSHKLAESFRQRLKGCRVFAVKHCAPIGKLERSGEFSILLNKLHFLPYEFNLAKLIDFYAKLGMPITVHFFIDGKLAFQNFRD
jgi:hypothetical protein